MATEQQSTKPGGIEFYGGYQVYSETGIDLTLLRENLKRTLEERLEDNRRAAAFAEALQESGQPRSAATHRRFGTNSMFDAPAILKQMSDHQVQFVLIGGLAMIAHGSAYITKDLDICYSRTQKNIGQVATAFAPLHPYLRGAPPGLPFRFDAATIQAGLNFTLTTDLGDVDLLGEVSGIGAYQQVFGQSIERKMYGLTIRVLSLEGLIAAKKAAGRIKDRNHLLELEELKKMRDTNLEG
jgi:predicted nucleotidyltransferase